MTRSLKNDQLARYGFGPEAMGKTKLCPSCDTLVTDGAKTCPACGQALPELTLLAWYQQQHPQCVHCGTVLRDNSLYCPRCGKARKKTRA